MSLCMGGSRNSWDSWEVKYSTGCRETSVLVFLSGFFFIETAIFFVILSKWITRLYPAVISWWCFTNHMLFHMFQSLDYLLCFNINPSHHESQSHNEIIWVSIFYSTIITRQILVKLLQLQRWKPHWKIFVNWLYFDYIVMEKL